MYRVHGSGIRALQPEEMMEKLQRQLPIVTHGNSLRVGIVQRSISPIVH